MRRRFIYDVATDSVVEVGPVRGSTSPAEAYATVRKEYDEQFSKYASPRAGERLTQAALEQASRREWAHGRFGNERRWAE
jgi:hypothetical protein